MSEEIAVIGSGMAGLAAAWICRQDGHQVHVFESQARQGMDAHTLDLPGPAGAAWVDVPLRVMSPEAWPSVLALGEKVGVSSFPVTIESSCSWLDRSTWLRTRRLQLGSRQLLSVGSWRYLNAKSLRMVRGLRQLRAFTRQLPADYPGTLGQTLQSRAFDPLFIRGLILPLLSTICTCREEHLQAWPARPLLLLLDSVIHKRPLLRLRGGTRALVEGLSPGLIFHSGSPVQSVHAEAHGVQVRNARGEGGSFQRVIVATQANQQEFLDAQQFARERAVLKEFTFDRGELFVHSDTRLLPRHVRDWTALNYMMDRDLQQTMFTVWVNAVEPSLVGLPPIFQSWNPLIAPDPALTLARIPLQRAVVSAATAPAQEALEKLHAEAGRRLFFCGSWASPGVPLLESAVRSALSATARLGVRSTWDPKPARLEPTARPSVAAWRQALT